MPFLYLVSLAAAFYRLKLLEEKALPFGIGNEAVGSMLYMLAPTLPAAARKGF
ncbi:hypothetical protein V1498_05390 [Peribacillus sp. SCS-26]|uniref:hypothetical protein n=1 Tax=Paraperibacillus marinus TaxID=3115295 RepID=UPI0039065B2B